jgi:hypothetical protein
MTIAPHPPPRWAVHSYVDRPAEKTPIKKFNLTKRQRKEITTAAVQTVKAASKDGDGNQHDDGELEGYLKSFW